MNDIGIILLAAGGSSRMKQCKQLLPFRGKSLIRHAVEMANATQVGHVLVVLGSDADRLQKELHELPVSCLINADWKKGIGTSIRCGVQALASQKDLSAVLFLLCDQPLVDVNILHSLAKAYRETHQPIVACGYRGTVGVPALFDRSYFPQLLALRDDEGAKRIIQKSGENVAIIPAPQVGIDVDTPEDYRQACDITF